MNLKVITISLALALLGSVGLNLVLAQSSLSSYDNTYGELAKQHLFNLKLLTLLQNSEIEVAISELTTEVKNKGSILAVCLQEQCSEKAKNIMSNTNAL